MIYIPFIIFLIFLIFNFLKYKKINGGLFILFLYLISSLFSILLFDSTSFKNNVYNTRKLNIELESTFVYCSYLLICIYPYINFNDSKIKSIKNLPKEKDILFISYILIGIFFLSLFNLYNDIIGIDFNELKEVRSNAYNTEKTSSNITGLNYIVKLIVSNGVYLWPLALLLFFTRICFYKKGYLLNILLLISSFSSVIVNIIYAGRTQLTYWLLSYLFLYLLFRKFLSKRAQNVLRILTIILFSIILFYFILVTMSRWENSSLQSLYEYIGQPFINFNYFYTNFYIDNYEFRRIFPFSSKFFGASTLDLNDYRDFITSKTGFEIGIFYTFMGDILVDVGKLGLFIYILIFSIFSTHFLKNKINKSSIKFEFLIVYIALVNLLLQGLFYYSHWRIGGEMYLFISALLYYLLKNKKNKKSNESPNISHNSNLQK